MQPLPARRVPSDHVFLSHSSDDRDLAVTVCQALEDAGVPVWIAPRNIPAGVRYAEALLDGIDTCGIFLVLYSAAADRSPHVMNEIERAASRGKHIMVVRIDDTDPAGNSQISFFLSSHHWLDASAEPFEFAIPRIVSATQSLINRLEPGRNLGTSTEMGSAPRETPAAPPPPRSIGIEVDDLRIRGCVLDLDDPDFYGAPVIERAIEPHLQNARGLFQVIKSVVDEILAEHFTDSRPVGIGVAVPGQVDLRAGTLKFGPNLYSSRNIPFKSRLTSMYPGVPIRIDNEVRCATRSELHLGVGSSFDSFACIFIGTGVGSGTVIDRRIHYGHNFCAGELGHIKIDQSGPPCSCGQIGCLETFVKAEAVVTRARAIAIDWDSRSKETLLTTDSGSPTLERIVDALDNGDEAAQEVVDHIGHSLGLGLANYMNLVNPAAIVVGGELMNGFYFHMIDEITQTVQRNALAEVSNTPIVQSSTSEQGSAIGAALMFHPDEEWRF